MTGRQGRRRRKLLVGLKERYKGGIEVTGRQGRRRRKLLVDLKERYKGG